MIQTIKDLVSAKADTTVALAREIWGYAELSYEETKSAAALIAALKQEGFTIEEGIADIPTAFTATFTAGSGKPVVGFLAEYDALSGLSQKAGQGIVLCQQAHHRLPGAASECGREGRGDARNALLNGKALFFQGGNQGPGGLGLLVGQLGIAPDLLG